MRIDIDIKTLAFFVVVTVTLCMVAHIKGVDVLQGLKKGTFNMIGVLPILVLSFLIAAMVIEMLPTDSIARWMGTTSGIKGLLLGCGLGVATPGRPFVDFPIAMALLAKGAGIGAVVAMLVAGRLWAFQMLPFELSILGPKVTAVRWLATLVFPPLAGFIAHLFFERFF